MGQDLPRQVFSPLNEVTGRAAQRTCMRSRTVRGLRISDSHPFGATPLRPIYCHMTVSVVHDS